MNFRDVFQYALLKRSGSIYVIQFMKKQNKLKQRVE